MPRSESTIASGGRMAYTALISASISAFFSAGKVLDLGVQIAQPVVRVHAELSRTWRHAFPIPG